jgi:DNA polymerase/3'-5' exonuclease PolX
MNEKLLKVFDQLIKQIRYYTTVKKGKDKIAYSYKLNVMRKARDRIKSLKYEVKSGKELMKYKGIGKGIAKRVDEILKTGTLEEIDKALISGKQLEYVNELTKVFGIGKVKANQLYTEYNVKGIDDLEKLVNSGKIDLPHAIKVGLKYYDRINTVIPRDEITIIYIYLLKHALTIDPIMNIRICGSYRREKSTSGDIDIIVSHPSLVTKKDTETSNLLQRYVDSLIDDEFIIASLTGTNVTTKYMGLCRSTDGNKLRRIDIRLMPMESYYSAILYFTGSGEFNRRMRSVAKARGYVLNEYGMFDKEGNNIISDVMSEKEIFDKLYMEYQQPKDRM